MMVKQTGVNQNTIQLTSWAEKRSTDRLQQNSFQVQLASSEKAELKLPVIQKATTFMQKKINNKANLMQYSGFPDLTSFLFYRTAVQKQSST